MRAGVVAAQGAFREHRLALEQCGCRTVEVRLPEQLNGLDALVLPGGESTAIGKLLQEYGLLEPLVSLGRDGLPIYGTCAGMVLLARAVTGGLASGQPLLGLMDITVRRNAFGRQRESFEAELSIPVLGASPYRGVFIRAPYVEEAGEGVEVLATFMDKPVMVRQGKLLATAFHPELTPDLRLHQYFLHQVAACR